MEQRKILFRAWVKDLSVLLEGVTVYADRTIGLSVEDFEAAIEPRFKHEYGEVRDGSGKVIMQVMEGDEWIFIDQSAVVIEQFTGLQDKNGKDIYEGDILSREGFDYWIVQFNKSAFMIHNSVRLNEFYDMERADLKYREVTGTIHDPAPISTESKKEGE